MKTELKRNTQQSPYDVDFDMDVDVKRERENNRYKSGKQFASILLLYIVLFGIETGFCHFGIEWSIETDQLHQNWFHHVHAARTHIAYSTHKFALFLEQYHRTDTLRYENAALYQFAFILF